jgi:hypothetical protein
VKINRRSWHYWIYELTFEQSPAEILGDDSPKKPPSKVSICSYTWRVAIMGPIALLILLLKMMLVIAAILLLLIIVAGLLVGLGYGIYETGNGGLSLTREAAAGDASSLLVLTSLVVLLGVLIFSRRYFRRTAARKEGCDLPLDTLELGWATLQSQWRRVCPVLEIEDPE